ncbi:hypothetical protein OSTOST_25104 [Ostertagia ostertagi]
MAMIGQPILPDLDLLTTAGTVCEVLNDYSVLHRIVGVEIDRMEIRLEAALERMVDRHFQSFAEEVIRNVKSTQEAILNKLDELTKTRDS